LKYSNPLPKEGINTTQTHPLKELLVLSSGFIALIIVSVLILGLLADKFARYIPFETELNLSKSLTFQFEEDKGEIQQYLQTLANQLASAQNLPTNMPITVHYVDNPTINAMASLGGNIIVFRGLLEKLNSENAIAMVLAHEIAHIQHRHPIQTLSRGVIISIALNAIGIRAGDVGHILGNTGLLTALTFSRQQEQTSDYTALQSLENHYGHINGATDLFKVFIKENSAATPHVTFLSTHPLDENRIQNILAYARQKGWATLGKLTPIPKPIKRLLSTNTQENTP